MNDLHEVETPEEEREVEEESVSQLDRLRKQREAIGGERTLTFAIPGYDEGLHCKYKALEWDELSKIRRKMDKSKNPRKELMAQADTLIEACIEFLVPNADGSKLIPLQEAFPELGEEPIRYDARLGQALRFEINDKSPARSALFKAFNNDLAVTVHHNEVAEWMQSSRVDGDSDFSD